jgi:hypothetical protein
MEKPYAQWQAKRQACTASAKLMDTAKRKGSACFFTFQTAPSQAAGLSVATVPAHVIR